MLRWFRRFLLMSVPVSVLFVCVWPVANAAYSTDLEQIPPHLREKVIKAAFIYNFAKFTTWPSAAFPGPEAPLRICALGTDSLQQALSLLEDKAIRGRKPEISQLLWPDEARLCHVLFVGAAAEARLQEILQLLDGLPVLTVSDMPDFARLGGVIGLETVQNKIRFKANIDAARNAGLSLSSKLLRLARLVKTDPNGG